jgi:hypothetical protein
MKRSSDAAASSFALRILGASLPLIGAGALTGCAAPGATYYAPNSPMNADSAAAQAQRDAQDRQIEEQQRQSYLANQQYQRDLQARQAREQQQNAQPSSNPVDQIADQIRAEQQKVENAGMITPTK